MTLAGLLFVQQTDARAELEAWREAIGALDVALADLAGARASIEAESQMLERIEASKVLTIEGANAETRKAKLTLELADDARYELTAKALRAARARLADADRRVTIERERCRLLRAALTVQERAA